MRYLVLTLFIPLLCACAEYNATHGLTCAPAYSPGTPAYKACLLRNGDGAYQDYDG
jgi:hypothetical protein